MYYKIYTSMTFTGYYSKRCLSSSSSNLMRILFFGTDEFSIGTLIALNKIRLHGGIISKLDVVSCGECRYIKKKKTFDIPLVIRLANEFDLKTLSWKRIKEKGQLEENYDIGVVTSFGDLIPDKIISSFSKCAINIHPSLLPRWRGAAPIIHTVIAGDKITGLSVIEVSKKKFDVGRILLQKEVLVPSLCSSDELLSLLNKESENLIPYVIDNIDYLLKNAKIQCEEHKRYAPKVRKSSGYIDFFKHSPSYLKRLQLGLPEKIGIHASWNGKVVQLGKITDIELDSKEIDHRLVGTWWFEKCNGKLWIKLAKGSISIKSLKFENKNEISMTGFINGYVVDKKTGNWIDMKFKRICT